MGIETEIIQRQDDLTSCKCDFLREQNAGIAFKIYKHTVVEVELPVLTGNIAQEWE